MKLNVKVFLMSSSVAAALLVLVAIPKSAPAQATVLNHADGTYCIFNADDGNIYVGPATLVQTPNGKVNGQCGARLTSGTPVSKAVHSSGVFNTPFGTINGDATETPSGNANINFSK